MTGELSLLNRQRTRRIDVRLLRTVIEALLTECLPVAEFDLTIRLVDAREMTRVNETCLHHAGSTDVITFDYLDAPATNTLAGELYVCIDEALIQAIRFRTTWPSEMTRYIIHGILHLQGYDDRQPAARRKMKRRENQLLAKLNQRFNLRKLGLKSKLPA